MTLDSNKWLTILINKLWCPINDWNCYPRLLNASIFLSITTGEAFSMQMTPLAKIPWLRKGRIFPTKTNKKKKKKKEKKKKEKKTGRRRERGRLTRSPTPLIYRKSKRACKLCRAWHSPRKSFFVLYILVLQPSIFTPARIVLVGSAKIQTFVIIQKKKGVCFNRH